METVTHSRHTTNGRRLASCRVSAVLEVAFPSSLDGREKPIRREVRALIFQMVAENPTWGAPRIHGELAHAGLPPLEPLNSSFDEPITNISTEAHRDVFVDDSYTAIVIAVLGTGHRNVSSRPNLLSRPGKFCFTATRDLSIITTPGPGGSD